MSNVAYKFNVIPIKIPKMFFIKIKDNLKSIYNINDSLKVKEILGKR